MFVPSFHNWLFGSLAYLLVEYLSFYIKLFSFLCILDDNLCLKYSKEGLFPIAQADG